MNEQSKTHMTNFKKTFYGVLSGVINVVLFNPFDRALNLAIKNHTTIFKLAYWKPHVIYQGIHHGIVQRTISYGLYYPIVDSIDQKINNKILASVIGSGTIGLFTSPVSSAKQQYWNSDQKIGILDFSKQMYKIGGKYAFFRGTLITIQRDSMFGFVLGSLWCYTLKTENQNSIDLFSKTLDHKFEQFNSFTYKPNFKLIIDFSINTMIGTFATILSAPFNYIRVMKYKTECNVYTSSVAIFRELIQSVNNECTGGILKKIIFTFHNKFNVGWGSCRVGLGMALSKYLHDYFKQYY